MKTIIIGSSNVYRFLEKADNETQNKIWMQKCTKVSGFLTHMENLEETDEHVIISVIENFMCEAVGNKTEKREIEEIVGGILDGFVETVKKTSIKLPKTKFVYIEPMERPAVPWYTKGLRDITTEYSRRLNSLQLPGVNIVKRCDLPKQVFSDDGVHLTEPSGKQFLDAILYYSKNIFEAQLVDEEQMEIQTTSGSTGYFTASETFNSEVERTIEEKLKEVIEDMEKRRVNDDMVFARIREELDFIANTKKEDRIMITGMTTLAPKPTGQAEARMWIRGVVETALEAILPGAKNMIQFVSPNRSLGSEVPACEVKIKEKEFAVKIRQEYGKQRKAGKLEGRVFVANCVTLGTRVRMEVLKAIGKKCSNPNEDMFVHGFTSRPVLQVKKRNGDAQLALTYVDAVKRFGGRVKETDLVLAYERAGLSFVGQMRQNFIVLTDKGVRQGGRNARGGRGAGSGPLTGVNKRPLYEGNDEDEGAKRQSGSDGRGGRGGGAGRGGAGRGKTPM